MSKRLSRHILKKSCAWIREHWNAANLDVPDEFLQEWIYVRGDEEIEPSGFHLAIFTFGFLQYDLMSHNVPEGVKRSYPTSELLMLFQAWQMKLALAEVHRKTDLRVKPMPLFAFPSDEQIEAWASAPFVRS